MLTTYRQLSAKEVINCTDGARLGYVTDIEICIDDCRVTALIISSCNKVFKKLDEILIPWDKIEKIGTDVIIVNYKPTCQPACKKECTPRKKLFFS